MSTVHSVDIDTEDEVFDIETKKEPLKKANFATPPSQAFHFTFEKEIDTPPMATLREVRETSIESPTINFDTSSSMATATTTTRTTIISGNTLASPKLMPPTQVKKGNKYKSMDRPASLQNTATKLNKKPLRSYFSIWREDLNNYKMESEQEVVNNEKGCCTRFQEAFKEKTKRLASFFRSMFKKVTSLCWIN